MQVTETLSDGLKRAFTVTVPAAEIEAKRQAKLTEVARSVRLPGFRPGKVPPNVVKQRYGASVNAEVLEEAVEGASSDVLRDRGLRSATQPKVDLVSGMEPGQNLEFKLELELLPDIQMPDFASLSLTRLKAAPSDDVVQKTLDDLAKRQRDTVEVTEARGAEKGETLTVDYIGRLNGEAFEGGTGESVNLEVAGPGFIPGFTEQIEGMKVGESRTIDVTFPDPYPAKDLAGKAVQFEITAKALRQPVAVTVDDAFAAKIGFETLDKLREVIVEQMQREYDNLSRLRIKRELLDALSKQAQFPTPETMVDSEFGAIWSRIESDLKNGTQEAEDKGKDEETLKREYREIAERRVRLGLLLSEISRVNNIQVAPEELNRALHAEAARYPGQETEVLQFFRKNPRATDGLRGPILEEKVVDFILDQAKIEEKPVTAEELSAEPEAEAA